MWAAGQSARCHVGVGSVMWRRQGRTLPFRARRRLDCGPAHDRPDGQAVVGHYFMQRQPDGSWKINGVPLVPAPDLTI